MEGEGFHGGLAGRLSSYPIFMNCLFDGCLLGPTTTKCGGMLGNFYANFNCRFQSCIYNPKKQTVSNDGSATFGVIGYPGGTIQTNGSGYALGDGFYMRKLGNEDQGTDASQMDKTELLNMLGGEWQLLDDGQLVPLMPVAKPFTGSGTEQDPYIISSADDWTKLKDNVMSGRDYRSKYFLQTHSFTTSEMVGSLHHPFHGMYDGGGNTITFNIGSEEKPSKWTYLAPFRYTQTDDKTKKVGFSNIHTAGDIYTSAKFAAGLIANAWGPIDVNNCRSSVSIHSSVDGDGTHGGFISYIRAYRNGNLQTYKMTGCTFDGMLLGDKTTCWGGIIGWQDPITLELTDCLFIPQEMTASPSGSETIFRCANGQHFIRYTRSYYYRILGSSTVEGTRVYSVTGARDDISFSMGTPVAAYDVSGLSVFDNGVMYDNTFYPIQGAKVTIDSSLKGYRYTCEGNGASINGSTLTMGNANTTVDAALIDWAVDYHGTEENPYVIQNTVQMDMLADRVNASTNEHFAGKYFVLGADIDYDGTENAYVPVGYGGSIAYYFAGSFDGQGHSISGININRDAARQGVFGVVNRGTVKNLTLTNSTIRGSGDGHGGIVGYLQGHGTVDNCHVASTVSVSGSNYVGGIVGSNIYGSISNSSSGASVNGRTGVGGIVGGNGGNSYVDTYYCTLKNNIYYGTSVTGSNSDFVGAIAGNNDSGSNHHFTYTNNYYTCTGLKGMIGVDVTANDGAVPALRDDENNTTAIGLLQAIPESLGTYSVTLSGRTLYKDGSWNTLCLPFDYGKTGPLADATIMELDETNDHDGHKTGYDSTTGKLYLYFQDATSIEAGKPYIVKWASTTPDHSAEGDLQSPVFTGVSVSAVTPTGIPSDDGKVIFTGNYDPVSIPSTGDNTKLYLGSGNTLYWPNAAMTIGCQRAYFQLNGITVGDQTTDSPNDQTTNSVRAFVLSFGEEEQTGIADAEANSSPFTVHSSLNYWYDLSGRRVVSAEASSKLGSLNSKLKKGIYVVNGRKVVVK